MCGVARRAIFLQQRLRAHHHAGNAVAALRRLLLDEGALDRRPACRGVPRPSTVRTCAGPRARDRRHAGEHRLAVHQHGAGAALAEAAAEFRRVELEIVAQHVEQRRARIGIDLVLLPLTLSFIVRPAVLCQRAQA